MKANYLSSRMTSQHLKAPSVSSNSLRVVAKSRPMHASDIASNMRPRLRYASRSGWPSVILRSISDTSGTFSYFSEYTKRLQPGRHGAPRCLIRVLRPCAILLDLQLRHPHRAEILPGSIEYTRLAPRRAPGRRQSPSELLQSLPNANRRLHDSHDSNNKYLNAQSPR